MNQDVIKTAPEDGAPDIPMQKFLRGKWLIAYLVMLTTFVSMSTDLYLPALPSMTSYFGVSEMLTNLTIILFFIFFSAASLVWGPMSDKHGRRPILLVGLIIYTAASFLCAVSQSIYMLIASRILQAVGAGVGSSISHGDYQGCLCRQNAGEIDCYDTIHCGCQSCRCAVAGRFDLKVHRLAWRLLCPDDFGCHRGHHDFTLYGNARGKSRFECR